jgi:hypothetical protein
MGGVIMHHLRVMMVEAGRHRGAWHRTSSPCPRRFLE